MLAVVSKAQESTGEKIYLLGVGNSEMQARQAAYAYLKHPAHHPFDDDGVFLGGHVVKLSPSFEELHQAAQWTGHYDENGQHVGEDNTDAHWMLMNALGCLYINAQGELDYTPTFCRPHTPVEVPPVEPEWDDLEAYNYD